MNFLYCFAWFSSQLFDVFVGEFFVFTVSNQLYFWHFLYFFNLNIICNSALFKDTSTKLPKDLRGLMGEANLAYARGAHEDAIKMCMEVVRQGRYLFSFFTFDFSSYSCWNHYVICIPSKTLIIQQ